MEEDDFERHVFELRGGPDQSTVQRNLELFGRWVNGRGDHVYIEDLRSRVANLETAKFNLGRRVSDLETKAHALTMALWLISGVVGILVLERHFGQDGAKDVMNALLLVWLGAIVVVGLYKAAAAAVERWRQ